MAQILIKTNLVGHTGICCTLSLSGTSVPSFTTCNCILPNTSTRVYCYWFPDDQTIFDQFTDVLPCKLEHLRYTSELLVYCNFSELVVQ